MVVAGEVGFHGLLGAGASGNGRLVLLSGGHFVGGDHGFNDLSWGHCSSREDTEVSIAEVFVIVYLLGFCCFIRLWLLMFCFGLLHF